MVSHMRTAFTVSRRRMLVADVRRADPASYTYEHQLFYDVPVTYLEEIFPYPVMPLHRIPDYFGDRRLPSHVILFDELLGKWEDRPGQGRVTVRQVLEKKGYREVWSAWNGFAWAQDDSLKRGRMRIWALTH